MKKHAILLMTVVITTVISCKKSINAFPLPVPGSPQQPSLPFENNDARTVLLKSVEPQFLSNPCFHFMYNEAHFVPQINFASGLSVYNLGYKRLRNMTNVQTNKHMQYLYRNSQVSEINGFSGRARDIGNPS